MKEMYCSLGISEKVYEYGEEVLSTLKGRFQEIDEGAEYHQLKVIDAMRKEHVGEACLYGTTGYGYDDIGRDTLEKVYAELFGGEEALVRPQITCGTHAIALALFSNLRPGDELLSIAGKPYDTLDKVIGLRDEKGSLKEYGISYAETGLTSSGDFDFEAIKKKLNERTRIVWIQRSRGYAVRPTLSAKAVGRAADLIHSLRPDVAVMVDNCYCEFVERAEPLSLGADLIAGSLIKNPGGGLAPIGGYLVGKRVLVENAANRLTAPGLGKEVGASLEVLRSLYQGLFFAPTVTASALKGAIFASKLYEGLKVEAFPLADEPRYDIIQSLVFRKSEALIAFCRGIQAASPVDSFVRPEPSPMPGYEHEVIMAAGAFISGSSIELSADGPLREPYSAYFQGGLTFPHAKLGILNSLEYLYREGLVVL